MTQNFKKLIRFFESFMILIKKRYTMTTQTNAEKALKKLLQGNKRFVAANARHPNQGIKRRKKATRGQKPFAVIVGCSDSRVPPEIIFDRGLGDLFIIRLAGNIVDDCALGSIEYAVDHLGTDLVVVLGHGKCGAITTAVNGETPHGHIGSIVKAILPAVKKAKQESGDVLENAIRTNVRFVVDRIKSSKPIIAKKVKAKKLHIIGAYYDIETGEVSIIE